MPSRPSPPSLPVSRALFVGRFQPLHLGHLDVVQRLARDHDEVVVGIGSANVSHSFANPFTGGERVEMVHAALREAGVDGAIVVPIPDIGRNSLWVSHVCSLVPSFDALFTNNPLMRRLFEEAGVAVKPAPFHVREQYEGTRIRALMRDGGEWQALVPKAVARVVVERNLLARIVAVSRSDGVIVEGRDSGV